MRLICAVVLLLWTSTVAADPKTISGSLAAAGFRVPESESTFAAVHLAFTRIVLNESGWRSEADAIGIFQSILTNSVGSGFNSRVPRHRASFLRYLSRVGNRTFPADSLWLGMTAGHERARHTALQKRARGNAYWTSSFKLDCSKPGNWNEAYPNTSWEGYPKRCAELVARTRAVLLSQTPYGCRTQDGGVAASPRWWGGMMDMHRVQPTWQEIICDDPEVTCSQEDRNASNTTPGCAKNRFFRLKPRQ